MDLSFAIAAEALWSGLWRTVLIFIGAAALGVSMSLMVGLLLSFPSRWVRVPARIYVELLRGTSAFVQLFWLYYALPLLTGIYLPALPVAIVAVGLNTSGYGAEIVRSALAAVSVGQREASAALGLSSWQTMRCVIVPQAVPAMIPPFGNLLIEALKNSALAMAVSVPELFFQIRNLGKQFPIERVPLYLICLAMYFAIALVITAVTRYCESRAAWRQGAAHV